MFCARHWPRLWGCNKGKTTGAALGELASGRVQRGQRTAVAEGLGRVEPIRTSAFTISKLGAVGEF